ncbi:MAG: zf-TFIIB domain-containing protein [Tabrizicola sp.]|uniref:TFIIB-type zinc ribbon-containing protein n=1 Tax=Tabrizicola sp. TaxID=2005166 RepID=UPI002ABCDFB9|nr:zf-TFIIB domain-containing protein [Tabrizicola sp.]MDZ4086107.1 zf-TFIIB domain-containing protein [Tabrizicola sp.]
MRCPVDNETLVMADRGGVEIDYCPKCRGVWLDRGELDKIIERSLGGPAAAPAPTPQQAIQQHVAPHPAPHPAPVYQPEPRAPQGYREDDRRRYKDDDDDYRYKKKRKDSFLSDIFDF